MDDNAWPHYTAATDKLLGSNDILLAELANMQPRSQSHKYAWEALEKCSGEWNLPPDTILAFIQELPKISQTT